MSDQSPDNRSKIHHHIKEAMRVNGTSFAQLSRQLGVSGASMSLVSQGLHRSKRIEEAIATAIGRRPEDLWPERYKDD
ncbi:helix-turn-helix domain-containing protein [Paracoccaceae bacterium GXU_MW_L88]